MWLCSFSHATFWGCVFYLPLMQVMFPFSVLSVSSKNVIFYMGLRFVFDKCFIELLLWTKDSFRWFQAHVSFVTNHNDNENENSYRGIIIFQAQVTYIFSFAPPMVRHEGDRQGLFWRLFWQNWSLNRLCKLPPNHASRCLHIFYDWVPLWMERQFNSQLLTLLTRVSFLLGPRPLSAFSLQPPHSNPTSGQHLSSHRHLDLPAMVLSHLWFGLVLKYHIPASKGKKVDTWNGQPSKCSLMHKLPPVPRSEQGALSFHPPHLMASADGTALWWSPRSVLCHYLFPQH